MLAHPSQHSSSERWAGHWGADAQFYARRSDGVCFAIDGGVSVIDLVGSTPASPHARPLDALPGQGRYTLRVLASAQGGASGATSSSDATDAGANRTGARLLAFGVRRRA